MSFVILIISAYLLGSIPFGLIIAKAHGKDIRLIGSGNIGATNVARALGRKWAYLCFSLDAAKGLIPMLGTFFILQPTTTGQLSLWLGVGCAAITGHIFPVYLKFRGGKGVATCLGVVLGLWPYYTLCGLAAFAVWVVFVLIWHYISLASIAAAVCFPVVLTAVTACKPNWHFSELWPLFIGALAMPALLIYRHRENIKRLIAGTESKISKTSLPKTFQSKPAVKPQAK